LSENFENLVHQSYSSPPKFSEIKAGLPEDYEDIKTLEDLLAINYKILGARDQIRKNLISLFNSENPRYPGIIGFEEDVIPSLDRALLSRHDVFLIGQIGQAKTKLVQTIAENLLSPIPVIENSLTNDCPMDLPSDELINLLNDKNQESTIPIFHISPESSEKIRNNKLDTKIRWIDGKFRFKYVLATPDISVKDLVGYIDAIKVAKKGIEMYKIDSYSPGQLMQAKHGLFCIDELPVLDPRKQVALLSVLQEGRFTTGAYPVIFKPKTVFFATANPIDYTHSGKIIEPLVDRLKSHIHTHYPKTVLDEMLIILQESKVSKSFISSILLYILANLIHKIRSNPMVNQERGVSVRLGIHGLELLVGESERTRAISHKITPFPRLCDIACLDQVAKFELSEMEDTLENRKNFFSEMIQESLKEVSSEFLKDIDNSVLEAIKEEFVDQSFPVSQNLTWQNGGASYQNQISKFDNLKKLVESKFQEAMEKQKNLISNAEKYSINTENIVGEETIKNETYSLLTELILEGLCWTTPKVLAKKEVGYVQA